MVTLIDNLLAYSKTSEFEISKEPLGLRILFLTEIKKAMHNYPDRKVELMIENEMLLVMEDKVLFKQIVLNILTNAIPASSL